MGTVRTAVEIVRIKPVDRPPLLSDVVKLLNDALVSAPESAMSIDPDGTLIVTTYRDVSTEDKLRAFLKSNPDITAKDIDAVKATM